MQMDCQVAVADRPRGMDQGIVIEFGLVDPFENIGFFRIERPLRVVADIQDKGCQGRKLRRQDCFHSHLVETGAVAGPAVYPDAVLVLPEVPGPRGLLVPRGVLVSGSVLGRGTQPGAQAYK
jgi:hypothetical protein